LNKTLREIELALDDVKAVGVITKDGLPISVRMPSDLDVISFSAISAALYSAAESALSLLGKGHAHWVYTETDKGTFIVIDINNGIVVALLRENANIGLTIVKLKSYSAKIKNLIS